MDEATFVENAQKVGLEGGHDWIPETTRNQRSPWRALLRAFSIAEPGITRI